MRKKLINKNKIQTISLNLVENKKGHLMHIATKDSKGVNPSDPGNTLVKLKGQYNPKTNESVVNVFNKKKGIVTQMLNPYTSKKNNIKTTQSLESLFFKKQKKKATLPKKIK